jgi:hypothetical protein
MTDADFIAWVKSSSRIACVLIEVDVRSAGVEMTRYLSNRGYTSGPTDVPANQHYLAVVNGGCKTSETLPIDGTAGMAFGDAEIDNLDGSLDAWLADVWANRGFRMYVGDMRWPRADFRKVFDGLTADLDSRGREVWNLKARDKLQRLNTAVTQTKLGGASVNADRLIPLLFGECHNIEPLLIDKALLKYQVHNGPIERIIEVRDNGVPVAFTPDLATGTFTLSAASVGVITCSAQGDKAAGVYANTVSKIAQRLATGFGTDPFAGGDLDAANLTAFDAANAQPVGIYLTDVANVLDIVQQLAGSVCAQVTMSTTGLLRLLKITLPLPGASTAVTAVNMIARSLKPSQRPSVQPAVKIGYCRNWTVQTSLQTGIPAEHKALFSQEWLTKTARDAGVAAIYKKTQEPEPRNTHLLVGADATALSAAQLALWGVQRNGFSYDALADLLLEELGGYQTITHARFGFGAGQGGQILAVDRDWTEFSGSFEVLT